MSPLNIITLYIYTTVKRATVNSGSEHCGAAGYSCEVLENAKNGVEG